MQTNDRQRAMRAFLATLVDSPEWMWIGRTAFRRGARGVFQLELHNGGHGDHVAGLVGAYLDDSGTSSRIFFWFADLLETGNPAGNQGYRGDPCEASERDWQFRVSRPVSMSPLHAAIGAWFNMFNRPMSSARRRGGDPA